MIIGETHINRMVALVRYYVNTDVRQRISPEDLDRMKFVVVNNERYYFIEDIEALQKKRKEAYNYYFG